MNRERPEAVVIGTSAGGIRALSYLLPVLPRTYPLPILAVIHLPRARSTLVSSLFADKCPLNVLEAEDKAIIKPSTIYFAPPDYHMLVEQDYSLSLSSEEPHLFSRPSIDFLFESAADAYGSRLIAIVLTGASEDGAQGLRAVGSVGGVALVESPLSAQSPIMPQAALQACPQAEALSLEQIAEYLKKASLS